MTIKLLSFSFAVLFLIAGAFVTVPHAHAQTSIVDGDLIRATGTQDVYIVKITGNKRFKRLILNPTIFNSYGHLSWANVKNVSHSTLNNYTTSNLVREVTASGQLVDGKVYALFAYQDTGVKRLVVGGNYDLSSVYSINHLEASNTFYRTGDPIVLDGTTQQAGSPGTVSAPTNLRVLRTTPSVIDLSWSGSAAITKYRVEWRVAGTNNEYWNFYTPRTIATIWGHIVEGYAYEIRVRAENAGGISSYTYTSAIAQYASSNGSSTSTSTSTSTSSVYNQPVSDVSTLPQSTSTPISTSPATSAGTSSPPPSTPTQQSRVSTVNRPDGTLEFRYYYRGDTGTVERIEKYRENGTSLLYIGYYRPDQTLQYSEFFRADGTIELKSYYNENETLMRIERYRTDGTLEQTEAYRPDGRLSTQHSYRTDGTLKQVDIYKEIGTLQEQQYYRNDGRTLERKNVHEGDGTVEQFFYLINGTLTRTEKHKAGVKTQVVYYRTDGTVERSQQYREINGSLEHIIYYYPNRKISRIEYYRRNGSLEQINSYNTSGAKTQTVYYDENEKVTRTVEH